MKAVHVNDWTGEYSFESDFTIGVVSRMGWLRLREITLYGEARTLARSVFTEGGSGSSPRPVKQGGEQSEFLRRRSS